MRLNRLLNRLGIRHRVLLLALLPTVLITLVLASYMIGARVSNEREALFERSETLARYLAVSAEFSLFTGDTFMLESLSRGLEEQPEVSAVMFFDRQNNLIYSSQKTPIETSRLDTSMPPPDQAHYQLKEGLWAFRAPVLTTDLAVDDFADLPERERYIGEVVLVVNDRALLARQRAILIRGSLIALVGLSLMLLLARLIGRSITRPIEATVTTVKQLQADDLDARVRERSEGELGQLEKGINALASRVQGTQAQLRAEVRQATADLEQTLSQVERRNLDLRQARQRADRANLAKDEFLARMSHELRTPLTSVLGFVQLLQRTGLDGEQREYSHIIQRTSSLLLTLIDDILDFSRLQSNAIELEEIPFSLVECVEDVLEMQAPLAQEKQIRLALDADAALPDQLLGDPTRLRQVVANLVSNAVKFTDSGSVEVSVRRLPPDAGATIELEVRDSGIGIEPERCHHLFKPFSQADTSISRRFGGSGLGLVITKRLVELMDGDIELDSQPGQGTCVRLRLPLAVPEQAPPRPDLGRLPILVLDPQPLSRQALCDYLERWNCSVTEVANERALLAGLVELRPEVVVLCMGMHGKRRARIRALLRRVRALFSGTLILLSDERRQSLNGELGALLPALQPVQVLHRPLRERKLLQVLAPDLLGLDEAPSPGPGSLAGLSLLVAEDNHFNRLLLQRMLEQCGARLTLVADGAQAVAAVQAQSFDVILMDIHMPGMDGIAASRRIRALPGANGRTPIIALTANVIASESRQLEALGIGCILYKPIDERQLVAGIRQQAGIDTQAGSAGLSDTGAVPRLDRYGISQRALRRELQVQVEAIHDAFVSGNVAVMRDHSHQLSGLAGLLELAELEAAASAFNRAVKQERGRALWQYLWRLERVIGQLQRQGHAAPAAQSSRVAR